MDYHIETILIGAIKNLRQYHIGYPVGMTNRQWNGIMDRIVNKLEAWREWEEDRPLPRRNDKEGWKAYNKEYRKRLKGRHDAIKLFGEHFSNFWD